jgi:putative transposase
MPHSLRAHVPGGSYFFTVALLERRRRLLTAHIDALRAAFRSVHTQRPFHIDAIVVLPDHLHCIWTLAPYDADFAFLPRHRAGAPVIIAKADDTRTGHLGNGDSGSTRSGSKGFRCAPRLHSLQCRQTWVGVARHRLAAFEFHRYVRSGVLPTETGSADFREWAGVTAWIANGGLRDEAAKPPGNSPYPVEVSPALQGLISNLDR